VVELYIGIFWILYFALHSVLASFPVKRFFRKVFPAVYPHYRALYSVIATVNFVLLGMLHIKMPSTNLFQPADGLRWIAVGIGLAGALVMWRAMKRYGASFLYLNLEESDTAQPVLVTTGLNAYVRHPLYFGILLSLVFLVLYFPSAKNFVFAGVTLAYLIIGSWLEEQRLLAIFGQAYENYRRRVKMLVPYVF